MYLRIWAFCSVQFPFKNLSTTPAWGFMVGTVSFGEAVSKGWDYILTLG